jgi:hypothetical protein
MTQNLQPLEEKPQLTLPQTQQEVASQAFESAVSPLRESFKEDITSTTENLARKGIAFGGVGEDGLGDVLKEQSRIKGNIATSLGAQLGQTALDQSFQVGEAAKAREFASEQAGVAREFSAEQAGLGREFSAEEQQKVRDFSQVINTQNQEFQASQADIQRQEVRNDQLAELVVSGNIRNEGEALEAIERIFGEGITLTPQDDVDLQRVAIAAGLSTDDFARLRSAIGQGQLAAVLKDPSQFIIDPEASQRFQLQLAEIQADAQVASAEAQTGGGKVLCTELYKRGLLPEEVYLADRATGLEMPLNIVSGYHFWAIPLVKAMNKNKFLFSCLKPLVTCWAYQMAYKKGVVEKSNVTGRILEFIGVPICSLIGRFIEKKGVMKHA